jgi:hypothetical protein
MSGGGSGVEFVMTWFEIKAGCFRLGIVTSRGTALIRPGEIVGMVIGAGVWSFHDCVVVVSARDQSKRAGATTGGGGGGEPTASGSAMPDLYRFIEEE